MGTIHVGLSGYSYKAWRGIDRFYPIELKPPQFLRHYATRYETVELDGTWYRMPTAQMVRAWIDQTPDQFLFTPKAHRQITHLRRLKPEALEPLQVMLERLAPLIEASRLGPVLLQLPPNLRRDDDRLHNFLDALPRHVRWAVEFRHVSWHAPEIESLLRDRSIAWVAADTDENPAERRDTAGFRYVRLRRSEYTLDALGDWAEWLKRDSLESFVYLKHEDEGAPWQFADQLVALVTTPRA
jgi:uncharacterized protein YecE (DUF72 family)